MTRRNGPRATARIPAANTAQASRQCMPPVAGMPSSYDCDRAGQSNWGQQEGKNTKLVIPGVTHYSKPPRN